MKAAVCRAFGTPLEIEELELADPEEGEARVEIAACAICSSDVHYAAGAWDGALPAVYGHEAAGVVSEVGPGVERVRPGDRVVVSLLRSCGRCFFCARGETYLCEAEFPADRRVLLRDAAGEPVLQAMHTAAFAEEVVVDQSQLVAIPDSLGAEQASLLACGVITGLGAVAAAGVEPGASVVVIGTGGVGINCVQGAALHGAGTIVAADLAPEKLDLARSLGATHSVDPSAGGLEDEVRALTGGRGADCVLVTVGAAPAFEQGLRLLRRGGTLVVVGMPPSEVAFEVVAVNLAYDSQRILGSRVGSTDLADAIPRLVQHYEEGRLKLDELVSGRFPLERINEAIASASAGPTLRNVIVLDAA